MQPKDKALEHFDDFYKQVFTSNWEWIREGLIGPQKYVAIVNNFSDSDAIMASLEEQGALNMRTLFKLEKQYISEGRVKLQKYKRLQQIHKLDKEMDNNLEQPEAHRSLEASLEDAEIDERRLVDGDGSILHEFVPVTKIKGREDYISESTHYRFYQMGQFSVKIETEYDFNFPEHLNVYCYEYENMSDFQPSRKGSTEVLNYYMMNGSSVLPVLALDLRPGNRMLDMCAAPGGKTLLAIQTLYLNSIVANDTSDSRTNRIHNVARQFLFDFQTKWLQSGRLQITNIDGRRVECFPQNHFDRVLVDVPCTNDRHSLIEDDNNIFKPSRIKERLKLPEIQSELLVSALKIVKEGGIVVYSTCSLSPIQNDGVVHMALKQIWEETKIEVVVM